MIPNRVQCVTSYTRSEDLFILLWVKTKAGNDEKTSLERVKNKSYYQNVSENKTEFKSVKLHLKIDLVLHPACGGEVG